MELQKYVKAAAKPHDWCRIYDNKTEMTAFYGEVNNIPDRLLERTVVSWFINACKLGPEMIFNID